MIWLVRYHTFDETHELRFSSNAFWIEEDTLELAHKTASKILSEDLDGRDVIHSISVYAEEDLPFRVIRMEDQPTHVVVEVQDELILMETEDRDLAYWACACFCHHMIE